MIFANITGWIVVPVMTPSNNLKEDLVVTVVLALVLGKYLDSRLLTAPWFFLGLTLLAFLVTIFGILKLLKKYLKDLEDIKKK